MKEKPSYTKLTSYICSLLSRCGQSSVCDVWLTLVVCGDADLFLPQIVVCSISCCSMNLTVLMLENSSRWRNTLLHTLLHTYPAPVDPVG